MTPTRRVAIAGLVLFVAIAVAEHALAPQLGPDRHTLSEYVNAEDGGVMIAGLVAWAISLLATAALACGARRSARAPHGQIVIALLLVIAATGLLLTATFATQTSAGVLPPGVIRTTGGRIHDLASLAATGAILGAVIVSAFVLRARRSFRRLAFAALATSLIASAVLLSIGDPVDGIRQRVLVAVGCAWQAGLIATLGARSRHRSRDVSET